MTRSEAVELIEGTNGSFFGIEFVKRTTGELRKMVCRTGVKSHLKGGELAYDPGTKRLVIVFDVQKNDYRSIPIEGITRVKFGGEWQTIETAEKAVA